MSIKQRLVGAIRRYPPLYCFLRYTIYARVRAASRKDVFLRVYKNNYWDGDYSISGPGSTLDATHHVRAALPDLLTKLKARSLLDIPCGDFQWMKDVLFDIEAYIGADIVAPLIEQNRKNYGERGTFLNLDLLGDALPQVDLILCRDCLVHLSLREIKLALLNIRKACPIYLVTTTFPRHAVNSDTVSPYWRALNFEAAPFEFPPPLLLIEDFADRDHRDKYLGVWRMEDLAGPISRLRGAGLHSLLSLPTRIEAPHRRRYRGQAMPMARIEARAEVSLQLDIRALP